MNQLEKFNKLVEFFFAENARFFEYYMGIFGLQDWRKSNMIWDALFNDLTKKETILQLQGIMNLRKQTVKYLK